LKEQFPLKHLSVAKKGFMHISAAASLDMVFVHLMVTALLLSKGLDFRSWGLLASRLQAEK
jgi:hypothetical protein